MTNLASLIEFYRNEPQAFIEDVLGLNPTDQQIQLIDCVKQGEKFISVKSGHGTGKSTIMAALILWFLCCFKSQVPITAPSSSQLFDALWSRLSELYNRMNPVFKDNFELAKDRLFSTKSKREHFCVARTAKKEQPESLQGFHSENLLFVVDEASGVDDAVFDVIMGALTEENNYCILIGNPLRVTGYFHDTFTKNTGMWKNLSFSSVDSPLVKKEFIEGFAALGVDSDRYRVRVLGEFPKAEADSLISLEHIEAAQVRSLSPSGNVLWGIDPARFGSDSSILIKRQGRKVFPTSKWDKFDTMSIAGFVAHEYRTTKDDDKPSTIFVDTIGLGSGVYDRLSELGLPVHEVNVSRSSSFPKEYKNKRAENYDLMREWFQEEQPDIPDDKELATQLSTIKYKFASNGTLQIEDKDIYKKNNPSVGSPDIADALMLTFHNSRSIPFDILFL